MRYDNEYIDGLFSLSVHIFIYLEVYQISCKAHKGGERLHKVFELIGLELQLPWAT